MLEYTIRLASKAEKQLDKLDDNIALPILDAIEKLAQNPRPQGYIKLKDREGFRIRKGQYRILYEIWDDILIVDVFSIGHRKDVY